MKLLIPRSLFQRVLEHCRASSPSEACGILAGEPGGSAKRIFRLKNAAAEPRTSYLIDPQEQFAAFKQMRLEGLSLLAIYHSHPATPAYPSSRDVELAFYPEAFYLIISLAGGEPEARAFRIIDGEIWPALIVLCPDETGPGNVTANMSA